MSGNRKEQVLNSFTNQAQQLNERIAKNQNQSLKTTGAVTVITSIPAEGLYIANPGTYQFGNDINWTPPGPVLFAAIVITCDNVEVDLKGFTLTAQGDYISTSLGIIVINGLNSFTNVTIKNGTVQNMGLCGVWAVNTTNLNIDSITVSGYNYSGFLFLPSGIALWNCNSFSIDSCLVENGNVTAMLGAGITLLGCTQGGTISNCTVQNVINNDGVCAGYFYAVSAGITANNCSVTGLNTFYGGSPDSRIGHTCIGFMPTESQNLTFTGCSATAIKGCCDDCHGMSLFTVDTAKVTQFTASNIVDGDCPQKTGAKATGLEVYGNNIQVSDCQVSDIIAIVPQDLQSTGFSVCGSNNTFTNCTATNVQVWNAQKQPDITCGYGTGFGWAPDPRPKFIEPADNVTYNNCEANNCQLGFDTWNHTNSNWITPNPVNCGLPVLIQSDTTVRDYQMNFCSELPGANPSSPSQTFPVTNCAADNNYPGQ